MKLIQSKSPNKSEQYGVVLVVSLVFLVALTAVAAALMQNSTSDMKMSGATEDKSVALQEVISAVDEVIFNERNNAVNRFGLPINGVNYPILAANLLQNTLTNSLAQIDIADTSTSCGHSSSPSSNGRIFCNNLTVTTSRNFGRNAQSTIIVNVGIRQKYIGNN